MSRQEQILQAFANTKCLWPSIFHRLPPQPEPKVVKALQFVNPDLNFLLLGQKSIIKILYHLWKSASIAPFQTPGNILWSSCSCLSLQLHLLASNFNRYKPSDCRWFFFKKSTLILQCITRLHWYSVVICSQENPPRDPFLCLNSSSKALSFISKSPRISPFWI